MLTPGIRKSREAYESQTFLEKADDTRTSGRFKATRRSGGVIDSDAIYNYTGKLKAIQRQFKGKEAKLVSDFLNALSDHGLSKGRITYYACRLPKIVKWFRKRRIALKDATKEDCKQCLRDVNYSTLKGKGL